MQIIDCDAYFGFNAAGGPDVSLQALLSAERRQGISHCMAHSIKSRAYDAREGNDDTLRAAQANDALLPVASVDPRAGYKIEEEIARVAKLGFVALRVFPELQGWPVDSALFARIVAACDEHQMPLMLSARAAGTASRAVTMAKDTSHALVLLGPGYGTQGEAFSAAASRPNTLVSTSQFITPGVVEIAADMVGIDNLVLGMDCPNSCIRPAVNMILGSTLSEADQSKVFSGNIRRVISSQLAKLGRTLAQSSDTCAYGSQKFSGPIIDVHGHLGPWPFPMRNPDGACVRELANRWGITKTILSHTKAIVNDFVEGNAELAKEIQGTDDLYGYVTINPSYPDRSMEEIERYLGLPNFVGVKFHTGYARVSIDAPSMFDLVARFADRAPTTLLHTWSRGEPTKVGRLAERFPQMSFIMGHGGADAWQEANDVIKNTPNTYTEFCNSSTEPGKVRATVDTVGMERVLFGTDAGLFDPAFCVGLYEEAGLTPQEQQAILRDNAMRLFRF